MNAQETVQKLKQTESLIITYLSSLGIEPEKSTGTQLIYKSPITGERTPSLYVRPQTNQFNCFSSGEKGDVIRLVQILEQTSFKRAVERLQLLSHLNFTSFSFSGLNLKKTQKNTIELLSVQELTSKALIDYSQSRSIPFHIAREYIKEVHYRNGNYIYYSMGFKSDKGGYALRNKAFKGWIGESGITTITVSDNSTVNVFEGFFDFLSALVYFKLQQPRFTTIILNSTANLKQALPCLQKISKINCFLDNDNAGQKALDQIQSLGKIVNDRSTIYKTYNDMNEMLIKHMIQKPDT